MSAPSTPTEILERAHKLAVTWDDQAKARYVLDRVGARIATAAVGLKDARAVRGWADGRLIKEAAAQERLQHLFQVVYAVADAFSGPTAAAFLRGSNPHLDDRAPVVVLAHDPPDVAASAVITAVRALLEE